MTQKILILTWDFVDDYELMVPYSILTLFGCEVKIVCPGKSKGEFIKTAIHYISIEDWQLAIKGKPVTFSESLGHPYRIVDDFDWKNRLDVDLCFDKLLRHIVEWKKGNKIDKESGINHLANAIFNILAIMYFDDLVD